MSKRTDIKSILILGVGPIAIDRAREFDCSGTQAYKALREEGYRAILVNFNPAAIMANPKMADTIYIGPIHWEMVHRIIEKEYPDTALPTMGGQMALNCVLESEHQGVLGKLSVTMIGTTTDATDKAEGRCRFDVVMKRIDLEAARSGIAHSVEGTLVAATEVGFPYIVRPPLAMGGSSGDIAYNRGEFKEIYARGLDLSPTKGLLIDGSLVGWGEYEMEVMRDKNDDCIIACFIEDLSAMGIRTGGSATMAPAQALTDKEYQIMRSVPMAVLREIGAEAGGSNVQSAVNPKSGYLAIIEMDPRVSCSSALASKVTNFPIAKVAARLAVGYTLDELMNGITGGHTLAPFGPPIDYVVAKILRFNFERFAGANDCLTTQMKSVGEVTAIGRTQRESLQKTLRGLEADATGLNSEVSLDDPEALIKICRELKDTGAERIWYIAGAFHADLSIDGIFNLTNIDRRFLVQTEELAHLEKKIIEVGITGLYTEFLRQLERKGPADARLTKPAGVCEAEIRKLRNQYDLHPVYRRVDTCAAEFTTDTVYIYSTYEGECEANPPIDREKVMVLGDGPDCIGQNIEFDYCCVHASLALREDGYETIVTNYSLETVSTDYDTSDRLCLKPVTLEDMLGIVRIEKLRGIIIQYGGQTPLRLARALEAAGVSVTGASPDVTDRAGDRERFRYVVECPKPKQPVSATVTTIKMAVERAKEIGYPLAVHPSYVFGGRAMGIIYDEVDLRRYFQAAASAPNDMPVLLSYFLDGAVGADVDAICDGEMVLIDGIMGHIEQAGVHSGDSTHSLSAYTLSQKTQDVMCRQAQKLAFELQVRGLMNVQFVAKNSEVYLIEVNPRAARTVLLVSKATGVPLAKVAARVMAGKSLAEQGVAREVIPPYYSVKEMALPSNGFPNVSPLLGPEMRSTEEVMGVGRALAEAFTKAQLDGNSTVKKHGHTLLSVREDDKERVVDLAIKLLRQGSELDATHGTTIVLGEAGINPRLMNRVHEGHPHVQGRIRNSEYIYIINTTSGCYVIEDSRVVHHSTLQCKAHYSTTLDGNFATTTALNTDAAEKVISVQETHAQIK